MVSLYTKGIFIFNKITGTYRPFTIVDEGTNYKECFYGYLPLAHQVANDKNLHYQLPSMGIPSIKWKILFNAHQQSEKYGCIASRLFQ